jgi:hypothetical protein
MFATRYSTTGSTSAIVTVVTCERMCMASSTSSDWYSRVVLSAHSFTICRVVREVSVAPVLVPTNDALE